jgi:hydroxymethylbilane synthase
VPTRIRRLKEGAYDAILIARAGVNRLALDHRAARGVRAAAPAVPARAGQGMLALELRTEDAVLRALAERLTIEPDRRLVEAERELLALFDGGCGLPLGAHARACEGGYELFAALGPRPLPDPGIDVSLVHAHVRASDPRELAPLAYEELLSRDFERDAASAPSRCWGVASC